MVDCWRDGLDLAGCEDPIEGRIRVHGEAQRSFVDLQLGPCPVSDTVDAEQPGWNAVGVKGSSSSSYSQPLR